DRLTSLLCCCRCSLDLLVFFFTESATTEIYTLSLHDALPIFGGGVVPRQHHLFVWYCSWSWSRRLKPPLWNWVSRRPKGARSTRSEEHTSELQSRVDLVCRLLLEKKKKEQTHG